MTTKVEPTVEKWEEAIKELLQAFFHDQSYWFNTKDKTGVRQVPEALPHYTKEIISLLSHSVQEAKAEERQVMITKLHNIRSKIHGYISLTELTDLLASLKQEEEQ